MRKTKRYIALLLLGAMLLSLLAGCKTSEQPEQTTQPPVQTNYGGNDVTAMSARVGLRSQRFHQRK